MSSLQAINIYKSFAGHYALKDVSLAIEAGEVHSLIGENGAGKSTLIKILTGIYKPDSGRIICKNKQIKYENVKTCISIMHDYNFC